MFVNIIIIGVHTQLHNNCHVYSRVFRTRIKSVISLKGTYYNYHDETGIVEVVVDSFHNSVRDIVWSAIQKCIVN